MWKKEHQPDLSYRANFDCQIDDTTVFFENGNSYKGPLLNGLKWGRGTYHDAMANMTYIGKYENGMRHGNGTLTSDQAEHASPEYVYDGEWANDKREGTG